MKNHYSLNAGWNSFSITDDRSTQPSAYCCGVYTLSETSGRYDVFVLPENPSAEKCRSGSKVKAEKVKGNKRAVSLRKTRTAFLSRQKYRPEKQGGEPAKYTSRCDLGLLSSTQRPPRCATYVFLSVLLAKSSREIDFVIGDGNCFFRAVSKELYGTERFHMVLRQQIVDFMERHTLIFSLFLTEKHPGHFKDMRREKVWATTAEIFAAATMLNKIIYLFTPIVEKTYQWFAIRPLFGKKHPCSFMTLCHTNASHFDRVVPKSQVNNNKFPPPDILDNFVEYFLRSI